MGIIFVLSLLAVSFLLTIAVLRFPEWFMRSIQRTSLWQLRDNFVDTIIDGKINKDSRAAQILKDMFENETRNISRDTFYSFRRFSKQASVIELKNKEEFYSSLESLNPKEKELLRSYFSKLVEARMAYVMLGSWYGIGFTLSAFILGSGQKGINFRDSIQKTAASLLEKESSKGLTSEDFLFYNSLVNN